MVTCIFSVKSQTKEALLVHFSAKIAVSRLKPPVPCISDLGVLLDTFGKETPRYGRETRHVRA